MGLTSTLRAVAQLLACAQLVAPVVSATLGVAAELGETPLACEEAPVELKSAHARQAVRRPSPTNSAVAPEQPPTVLWNVTELLKNKYVGY